MKELYEILGILMKYQVVDYIWAEHDVIGLPVDEDAISKEDMETLESLGVCFDSEYGSLVKYV